MLSDDNAGSSRRSTVAGGDSDHQGGPGPSNLSVDPSKNLRAGSHYSLFVTSKKLPLTIELNNAKV